MNRVALIIPNFLLRDKFGEISDPPIGVASIASYLERHSYEVMIVDGMCENLSDPEIVTRLEDFKPQFIGIGCNYSPLHNPTIQLAKSLRNAFGHSVFIFAGGNHATSLAYHLLEKSEGAIDCIARGEGETTTLTLIEALTAKTPLNKIPGITFLDNGNITSNRALPLAPKIEDFGMPAYHLLPMDRYKRYNIITMRGCPYACSYCASTAIFKRKVRYRSPDEVLKEIEHLLINYGNKDYWFSDDTFTVNRKHTETLLLNLIQRDLSINWSCLTTVHTVQKKLLEMMDRAGCSYISYGIETGNTQQLAQIGKKISVENIIATSHLTHEVGIPHYGFFIFGFPGETWDTIKDTYNLISEAELDGGGMNILIPLPGTKLWQFLYEDKKMFALDEIQWDELFARLPNEDKTSFAAQLASRWCSLSAEELIKACNIGQQLFGNLSGNANT